MNNNHFLILNEIIYKIYNIPDFEEMKKTVLQQISAAIPYSMASIYMGGTFGGNDELYGMICVPETNAEMGQNYSKVKEYDFFRWMNCTGETVVVKASALMPESERIRKRYYKLQYEPYNVHYSVFMTIAHEREFLGILVLYRPKDDEDFREEELFILRLLSSHLNIRFHREKYGSSRTSEEEFLRIRRKYTADYSLTEREVEILHHIFCGESNEEICEELYITYNTLKKHLQNLYRKTGVSSRSQLWSLQNHLRE